MSRKDSYTQIDRKTELYSDFLTDLNPHPDAKDIVRFTNENAVKRSIRNLVMTNKYDRLFQPDIYADIHKILFEPMNETSANLLRSAVTNVITNHEPRCKLIDVSVSANEERHLYAVSIIFAVINNGDPIKLDISLYRVR